jgi:hypothetical protein
MPVDVWFGARHELPPKVIEKVKKFFELSGVTVPENEQLPLVPVNVPLELTLTVDDEPSSESPVQLPTRVETAAGVL